MSSNFTDVGIFHRKFGLYSVNTQGIGPREVSPELVQFRINFMQEELDEFKEAYETKDYAKLADALVDLVYVAMGTAHLFGFPWGRIWNSVQKANMAKRRALKDGSDSARGSQWDIVKPEGWTPPNVQEILRSYGWKM